MGQSSDLEIGLNGLFVVFLFLFFEHKLMKVKRRLLGVF